ncbi:MAG: hypothetical protein Q4G43_10390 [Mobilicoccus sp.]|nr:hypothetical protein [Mobilicoccus sp.]
MITADRTDQGTTTRLMTWARPRTRPLALRVDRPRDGEASGALVVVPPPGRERVVTFRALRALAVVAARAGFVVLSPDLTGQGDSAPARGVDLIEAWTADVEHVVALAQQLVPGRPVHTVGLRLGACLADAVPTSGVRVLWEPIDGRIWLRRQRRLRTVALATPVVPDGTELPGLHLSDEDAASIATLTASDDADPSRLVRRETDRLVADQLFNTSPHGARIPAGSIAEIVDALPHGDRGPMAAHAWPEEVLMPTEGGVVVERWTELGPARLPAVFTRSASGTTGPALVFTPMGAELRSGPGDLWTDLARAVAADGGVAIRSDRRGLGDALDVTELGEPRPYVETAPGDVAEAARLVRTLGARTVVGVGLCAGAWSMLRAGDDGGTVPFDRVVALNSVHWDDDVARYDEDFYEQAFRYEITPPSVEDDVVPRLHDVRRRVLCALAHRFPRLRAWYRGEDGSDHVGLLLGRTPAPTDVHLVLGTWEHSVFRAKDGQRAVRHRRGTQVSVVPSLDHSLLATESRRTAHALVQAELAAAQRSVIAPSV